MRFRITAPTEGRFDRAASRESSFKSESAMRSVIRCGFGSVVLPAIWASLADSMEPSSTSVKNNNLIRSNYLIFLRKALIVSRGIT